MRDEPYLIDELADRLAIHDVISRYVHGIDSRDYDRLDDVFLPDCSFDLSTAGGSDAVSWTELKPWYAANLGKFEHYLHSLTNLLIEFSADGTEARSVCKVINPSGMRTEDGEMHFFEITGHWHDQWVKSDEGWRIVGRRWEAGWIWGDYPFSEELGADSSPERS